MADGSQKEPVTAFRAAFCAQTKLLRERKGWTQEQMAVALGVPVERWRKYERRSPLPHDLIPRFCTIVDVSIDTLFRSAIMVTVLPAKRRPRLVS